MRGLHAKIQKQNALNKKFRVLIQAILCRSTIILGSIFIILNVNSAISSTKNALVDKARITALDINNTLCDYAKIAKNIATDEVFLDLSSTKEEREKILQRYIQNDHLNHADYIDINDKALSGQDYSSDADIAACKETQTANISQIVVDKEKEKAYIAFNEPVIVNDQYKGMITIRVEATFLSDLLKDIDEECDQEVFVIQKDGQYLAYKFYHYVTDQMNLNTLSGNMHFGVKKLAAAMEKGEIGNRLVNYHGLRYTAYVPIPGTQGWSVATSISCIEMIMPYLGGIVVCLIMMIMIIVWGVLSSNKMTGEIIKNIEVCIERIDGLSKGDFTTPVVQVKTNDEVERLSIHLGETITEINTMINDITHHLKKLESGDFKLALDKEYVGDFKPIKASFENFIQIMGQTLASIQEASQKVASESDEMERQAATLATGAGKQRQSVEMIAANMQRMNESMSEESEKVTSYSHNMLEIKTKIEQESKEKINELTVSMTHIEEASSEISKIIQSIEEIARQTNLLALNASIEAARAGESGKGFSVVAREIGQLASQSTVAASSTEALIENAIATTEAGRYTAKQMEEFFDQIMEEISTFTQYTSQQAAFYDHQVRRIDKMSQEVSEIAEVAEGNLLQAECTEQTSMALAKQSMALKDDVNLFRY